MNKTLHEISQHLSAELIGDPHCEISAVLPLDKADPGSISFVNDIKYLSQLSVSNAAAIIIAPQHQAEVSTKFYGNLLIVDDPYLAFAKVSQLFDSTPKPIPSVSNHSSIAANATIGKNVFIGDFVSIGENVSIGDNTIIEAGTVVSENAKIGKNCRICSNVSIYHAVQIGDNCIIHASAVIGSDGFGYANDKGDWVKIPQVGSVIIGNNVEIGAHTAIDRGALENTQIADGVILDNHIHIAHNVTIGQNTAIAGCTAIAGSSKIGAYCTIAGRVSIIGHLEIADKVHITACTLVNKSIKKSGAYSSGTTVQTNKDWQKSTIRFKQLDDMWRKLKAISKELAELKNKEK